MDYRKDLLISSAARLYSMGVDLENARVRLRQLVERGVSYDSDEMKQAYRDFRELEQQWKALEKQHLELRNEILLKGRTARINYPINRASRLPDQCTAIKNLSPR